MKASSSTPTGGAASAIGCDSDEQEGSWVGRWLCCGRPGLFLPHRRGHQGQDKDEQTGNKLHHSAASTGKFVTVGNGADVDDEDVDGKMAEDASRLRLDKKPPSPRTLRNWPMSGGVAKCVQHPWGLAELKNFAELHYGSPMVLKIDFIKSCLDYKTDGIGTTARVDKARKIWDSCLDSDVPDAVDCVDTDTLRLIRRTGLESGAKDLFDAALGEVLGSPDVSTAFNEFLQSDVVKRASSMRHEPPGVTSAENNNFR